MKVNKSSPKLLNACATGEHFTKAILTCRNQQDCLKVTFWDLLVSSFIRGGPEANSAVPIDRVSFKFAKIDLEYGEQKPDGSLRDGM